MKVIGLTGGIAAGKSTLAGLFVEKGGLLIDADQVAQEVMREGSGVYNAVVRHFGESILKEEGGINREKLGAIVFSDPKELAVLNKLTHGPIVAKIRNRLKRMRVDEQLSRIVVLEAPLLVETGLTAEADVVIVVACSQEEQLRRLVSAGHTEKEALQRIKAQATNEQRAGFADFVIENDGSLDELKAKAEALWEALTEQWRQ